MKLNALGEVFTRRGLTTAGLTASVDKFAARSLDRAIQRGTQQYYTVANRYQTNGIGNLAGYLGRSAAGGAMKGAMWGAGLGAAGAVAGDVTNGNVNGGTLGRTLGGGFRGGMMGGLLGGLGGAAFGTPKLSGKRMTRSNYQVTPGNFRKSIRVGGRQTALATGQALEGTVVG